MRQRPRPLLQHAIAFMAAVCILGVPAAQARLAELDPSFGQGGIVQTGERGFPSRVLVEPDGSFLVLMTLFTTPERVGIARFLADGSLDHSFGSNGVATTAISDGVSGEGMTLASDSKILVVGTSFVGSNTYVTLLRYRANGSLDSSFGQNGIVQQSSPSIGREGRSVLVQSDRKILVGGWSQGFMVARYDRDGKQLDPTFDGDGVAGVPGDVGGCGTSSESGTGELLFAPGGSIIAGGECGGRTLNTGTGGVLRFHGTPTPNNGALDTSFGSGGAALAPFAQPNFDSGLIQRRGGNLVQAVQIGYGNAGARIGLAGYTPTGTLDPSFGTGGSVSFDLGTANSDPAGVAPSPDGKLLVAAYDGGDDGSFALVRRLANGSADPTFAPSGSLLLHVGQPGPGGMSQSGASTLAVQADGRVIEAGTAHENGKLVIVLTRFGRPPALSRAHFQRRTRSVRYRDNQASMTTVKIFRLKHGRRKLVGSLTHLDHQGKDHLRLPRRLHGRKLGPGRYVVILTPEADGLFGRAVKVRLQLV
jgi:uncharacterized delta-60 repeat protein